MKSIFWGGLAFFVAGFSSAFDIINTDISDIKCYQVDDNYLTETVEKKQSNWTHIYTAFEDSGCQTPYLKFYKSYQVKLKNQNLDMQLQTVAYSSETDETTDALNLVHWCGFNNWKTKEIKEVTGLICGDYQAPAMHEMLYTIYSETMDQNIRKWTWGITSENNDGKSPETRHKFFSTKWFSY